MSEIFNIVSNSPGLPSLFDGPDRLVDAVSIVVGTKAYSAWQSVSIGKDLDSLCSTFSIEMADKWKQTGGEWPIKTGAPMMVRIGKETVMNGYIDKLDVSVSNEDRSITANGRDRTGDLVDSSALSDKNQFKNVTVKDLCDHFCSLYGIPVLVTAKDIGKKFSSFSTKQGETVFECLERAAKLRGLLLTSNYVGALVITNRAGGNIEAVPSVKNLKTEYDFLKDALAAATQLRSPNDLVQGENIISASASYDNTDRFQQYLAKGQSAGTDSLFGIAATQPQAAAFDRGIERFRPKIVIAEGNADIVACQKRAAWEATVRAAKACQVNVVVQGWLRSDKTLWAINELVNLQASYIGIPNQQMLVVGINFTKDQRGTLTTLKLTRPDAFNPKLIVEESNDPLKKLGWSKISPADRAKQVNKLITNK